MIETYFKAFAVALIEGLTEFIPVSSTGHMILFGDFIAFTGEKAHTFEVFIQLGAILAALFVYKEKFLGLLPQPGGEGGFFRNLLVGQSKPTSLHILLGIVPIMLGGFLLHKTIKEELFSVEVVALGLIIGGVLMLVVDRFKPAHQVEEVEQITFRQAFWIGIGQCMALWPGMSRSGSTMISAMLVGVKAKAAADFSFIIAVPVMVVAVGYDLLKSWHFLELSDLPYFLIGFVTAFVVAFFSIRWFLGVLNKIGLMPFGIYRILVGALTLLSTKL